MDDVDLYEINEAYACLSVAITKELKLNPEKVHSACLENLIISNTHPVFIR